MYDEYEQESDFRIMRNAKTVNCSTAHGIISNAMILEAIFAGKRDFPGGFWWFIIFDGLFFSF